jgi:hypothetical protein
MTPVRVKKARQNNDKISRLVRISASVVVQKFSSLVPRIRQENF